MTYKNLAMAVFLAVAGPVSILPAHAETQPVAFVPDNAEQRINFSGRLRMLSQRIPAAACHLTQGVDAEAATTLLASASTEFEKILTGLEFGDADLNIQAAEQNRRTLTAIATLRERWEPLKEAADAMAAGAATEAQRDYIFNANLQVLAAAQSLVEQLVRQYSNPNAMTFSSLMLIDISGRQRMLTQKMSKESCLIASGSASEELQEDLQGTMAVFETSLHALRDGMPNVGIQPPPNDEIRTGLEGVTDDWETVKPYLSDVLAGVSLPEDTDAQKFHGLNQTMVNMNRVVGMYADAAQRLVPLTQ
ncbi:type IV pili methyl-accepting chemotaxis transducer N-terminal domain-containing protein [Yoonia sp. BS5-3]|uniref:Type IV pili methyl-accepting chemotaxis transducer N-terminal domain-containing protein n=1 Tax=Yoonia phaeophyticola TaxID=3137369 RepID=A0ABZ2V3A1_9RHOB